MQYAVAEIMQGVAVACAGFGLCGKIGAGKPVYGDDGVARFQSCPFGCAAVGNVADEGAPVLLLEAAA